jgi:hypothetical protein
MRILISNDDGIYSPGILALAQLPHFSDGFLISCGLAGAFSDYFGSIA